MGEINMINKSIKALITYVFTIGIFLLTIYTLAGDNPNIDITLSPENPAPKSVVTFSVDIDGDSISTVRLIIRECDKETGTCHFPQNISMSKINDDTYETAVQLEYDDVNSITYQIVIQSGGKWTEYNEYTADLSIKSDKNENNSNGTPGFEIMVFVLAMIGFLLFKSFKSK